MIRFLAALALMTLPAAADPLRLLMVEKDGCIYCQAWDRNIGPGYAASDAGRAAPLMRVDIHGPYPDGLAYVLALRGGRLVTSGEAGLISMLDVVLGPFWVWLFYAERPNGVVLVSSLVVLAAVVWYLVTSKVSASPALPVVALPTIEPQAPPSSRS